MRLFLLKALCCSSSSCSYSNHEIINFHLLCHGNDKVFIDPDECFWLDFVCLQRPVISDVLDIRAGLVEYSFEEELFDLRCKEGALTKAIDNEVIARTAECFLSDIVGIWF
mmetsp:Transcript_33344/g.131403  ORF Transcript_33344/g.131403 Transcript_33344/m.131403 type:complete len:111 (+) Transcript_33344:2807-3139(+)